jgi:V8-like Glu-specific endopeptidase
MNKVRYAGCQPGFFMKSLFQIFCLSLALWLPVSPLQAQTAPVAAQSVSRPTQLGNLTQQMPYAMAGQLIFTSGNADYQGSGTVVQQRSVLTAAHNLWDAENGWSTAVEFNRARSGRNVPNHVFAKRLYIFGGYRGNATRSGADSLQAFATDLGGLRFSEVLAGGTYALWRANPALLTGESYNIALGYGAEQHSGDDLLFVEPTASFFRAYSSFYENDSLTFEGGMSGGPVFAEQETGDLRLVGVIVAGSDDPPSGGIRALNDAAAAFINLYLRY